MTVVLPPTQYQRDTRVWGSRTGRRRRLRTLTIVCVLVVVALVVL